MDVRAGSNDQGRTTLHRMTMTLAAVAAALLSGPAVALAQDEVEEVPHSETITTSWTAASAASCADPAMAALLSDFKDDALYSPAPGGTFAADQDGGWVVEGPGGLLPALDGLGAFPAQDGVLALADGARATSPTFCVDDRYPHLRFAARRPGRGAGKVTVEVLYPGAEKNVRKARTEKVDGGKPWKLSGKVKLEPLHGLKKGHGWRLVALRFTVEAKDGGVVHLDDVLVDPRSRG